MKKNKLILCDLDGTLFDTLEVNYYSYKESLNKFNYDIGYDFFLEECYGKYYKNFLSKLGFNEEEMEKIHKIKKELYRKYLGSAKINENLFDMLQIIKDFYHIALVTTASQKNSEEILNFFMYKNTFSSSTTSANFSPNFSNSFSKSCSPSFDFSKNSLSLNHFLIFDFEL